MHYFAYIFKLGIFENKKNITLASQWPMKVVQIHMPHPVDLLGDSVFFLNQSDIF